MESGNGHTKHEPQRRDSRKEFIADARMRFDVLRVVGVLTESQASSIMRLLECDAETLSLHDRLFRDNITRYLKKKADFVTVFGEMLQIGKSPAHHGPPSHGGRARKNPRVSWKTSNAGPSVAPAALERREAFTSLLALPPVKTYILPTIIASGAMILAVHAVFMPVDIHAVPELGAKSAALEEGVAPPPPVPAAAIFPSSLSPEHVGEPPYEAYLHTCYDQFKANRETNANGGLSWNQNGGGYYSECLKRLKR